MVKGLSYLLLCCFLLISSSAFAASSLASPYTQTNHFEVIGALGLANLKTNGNTRLGVTSSETDTLVPGNQNNWNTGAAQLGVGYVYYFHPSTKPTKKTQWFPAIEPQLNLYYLNNNSAIKGDVWRFGSSAFNQLTYKMPIRSTRLMLDLALTVVKKKQSSLYVKAGVGTAWNRISYSDQDNGTSGVDCVNQNISLNASNQSNFAWELGVGVLHDFNNRVGLSLEYLYTGFGSVKSSSNGNTGTITAPVIVPGSFNLRAQTGLLGLHFAV